MTDTENSDREPTKNHVCDVLGEVDVPTGDRCEGCGRRILVND